MARSTTRHKRVDDSSSRARARVHYYGRYYGRSDAHSNARSHTQSHTHENYNSPDLGIMRLFWVVFSLSLIVLGSMAGYAGDIESLILVPIGILGVLANVRRA